ncbi:LysR family transcriptional regulator [Arthrobacter sp. TB 26]|uniref:LysR family transcriptional regulator n=1 Tax=Arthrobacter sp. TB 26 TaxID=494420 RepID=UPI0003F9B6D0|nr:LysR family transcriptional regulator [Arthrobacter sp. TB 26]
MDLRQLRYVIAVAEEGGFRPAARRLYTAQPPLSMAIRQLENELGVKLFERNTRGVIPTQAGWELVNRAHEILELIDTTREAVREGAGVRRTAVKIAVLSGELVAGELTAPILEALRSRFEGAEIFLHETTFIDQVEALRSGDVDIAFVRPPISHSDLATLPITQEPRCLIVGRQHPLAEAGRLSADEVLRLPMLDLSAPPEWARIWQLDDLRGGSLLDESTGPVRSVSGAQLALTMSNAAITMSKSTTRLSPSTAVRSLNVEGLSPSVFAVAHRRSDTRRLTRDIIDVVAAAAKEHIHLLPEGELLV